MAGADDDLELDPSTPPPEPEEIDPGPPIEEVPFEEGSELEVAAGPARPRGIDPGPELDSPLGALEIIPNAPPEPSSVITHSRVELPLSEPVDLVQETLVPTASSVRGILFLDEEEADEPMTIDRSQLPCAEQEDAADGGLDPLAPPEREADEPMELEVDPRGEPAPLAKAGAGESPDAGASQQETGAPPPSGASRSRPAAHASPIWGEVRARLDAALAELAAMPEIDSDRGRVIVVRRLLGELSPIEAPDVLAELLVYALLRLPVSPSERVAIEAALIERLPPLPLIRACAALARLSATQDGEVWLNTAARIICSVASRHPHRLDSDAIGLARALAEHAAGLIPRLDPDLRDWARAGRYMRASPEEATVAATALDSASAAYEYAAELAALERAARLLVAAGRSVSVAPLVAKLDLHRDPAGAPFAERAQMAAESFDRLSKIATRGRQGR